MKKRSVLLLSAVGIAAITAAGLSAVGGDDACNRLAGSPEEPGNRGVGVESWKIDHAQAIPACEATLAADPDSAAARFRLGRAIQAAGRDEEALRHYKAAAAKGYVIAASTVGTIYLFSRKVTPDPAQAIMWYRRAADAGDAKSQFQLGEAHWKGQGVPRNIAEALNWYRKAADQQNAAALFMVAQFHDTGTVVPRDLAAAFNFYLAAAKLDYPAAQQNVGTMYARGEAVAADPQEAARWFEAARKSALIRSHQRVYR